MKRKTKTEKRFYRKISYPKGLISFQVSVKETDLWISAIENLSRHAETLILDARNQVESYIKRYPEFLNTLLPWHEDMFAPPVVKEMIKASRIASVGPMSAVAGAIAEYVGKGLLRFSDEVIVENGGDVFLMLKRDADILVYSGNRYEVELRLKKDMMPAGVCSSSGKIGHSLSFGNADVVTVFSNSASLSDATATAIANRIKKEGDLKKLGKWASQIKGIFGVLAIVEGNMSIWGEVEILCIRKQL